MDLPSVGEMSSTNSANPLACVAGMSVIDEINKKRIAYSHSSLVDRGNEDNIGYLSDRLATTFDDFDFGFNS